MAAQTPGNYILDQVMLHGQKKKDLWDVPLWNSLKDSSCYQVVEQKPLLENQPLQAKCQETKVNWFI